ncbi:hypothetical protein HID58_030987 [Brassica napus]|uniref:Peptidase C1A papain C-terminal domain-containing protein n=2 Tax=Brassica napus TaxID=3708 RepID=A0ABQ8CHJ6_BRANA|nr:hypothetical protein HID58_030987 [Brassica napus]
MVMVLVVSAPVRWEEKTTKEKVYKTKLEQARKALQDGDPAEEIPFPEMYTIKARIVEKPKATPQDILTLLPTQGPIGISIDMDEKFSLLEDNGIHIVQEPKEGMKRHALIIVGHGRTKDNQLFFIVQNTWGTSWCNNGYARIIIEKTCPIFYVEALLA